MTMEDSSRSQITSSHQPTDANASGHRKISSGSSILTRFPFLRTSESKSSLNDSRAQQLSSASGTIASPENAPDKPARALAAAMSQQKTRRRRGSLRKVALLGRGAAREKRDLKPQPQQQQLPHPLALDTSQILLKQSPVSPPIQQQHSSPDSMTSGPVIGLGLSDAMPRPSTEVSASRTLTAVPSSAKPFPAFNYDAQMTSPTISYTSTTDEDEGLSMSLPVPPPSQADRGAFSSGSESYFGGSSHRTLSPAQSIQRRRSINKHQYAKSPLSLQGISTGSPALGNIDSGYHDYGETEWWGWVVLIVTWFVFIIGMGSCLNIWSWAWDVGSTPYAPPELEDDPTLPIVGYYPALMILTSIMAWVWVIVAWVGMKYFRHAKISGD
ncbi:hypothetical protein F5B22DRAFT_579102 [Xylaria bambusicola]|uniref:uncharacterized protein n=1 Tax=Xylaria bambusicola TaxID=326684 RepID=UPI0020079962|nr:uncharacterized protein F5B22DRAFT_579102 [Xylaria bambusicola]KAI0502972.1 hypothetical protein F5B22DRAFT_579102 [Xylaria bambusicola]